MSLAANSRKQHPPEIDVALYATGDLALVTKVRTAVHVHRCGECSSRIATYRADRKAVNTSALSMPSNVDWDRLAEEMTGNIRVGLAAGECVAPAPARARGFLVNKPWQQGLVYAGLTVLMMGAWWLNMPGSEPGAMRRIGRALWTGTPVAMLAEPGAMVETSPLGVQVKENGSAMAVTTPGSQPIGVSVSLQGSARARYVDADTGQMTITTVYVQ
jgi:hypothetical protein